jgi:outer membrane protein TolC
VTTIKLPPASSLELALAPGAQKMNIADAIGTAVSKNPEILTAIQQIRLTKGQLVQVRAALLPQVQAGTAYQMQSEQ